MLVLLFVFTNKQNAVENEFFFLSFLSCICLLKMAHKASCKKKKTEICFFFPRSCCFFFPSFFWYSRLFEINCNSQISTTLCYLFIFHRFGYSSFFSFSLAFQNSAEWMASTYWSIVFICILSFNCRSLFFFFFLILDFVFPESQRIPYTILICIARSTGTNYRILYIQTHAHFIYSDTFSELMFALFY